MIRIPPYNRLSYFLLNVFHPKENRHKRFWINSAHLKCITVFLYLSAFCINRVHAAVVINEILPKPSDEVSEWIELYNTGPEAVALAGWRLQNLQGTAYSFPSDTVLPVGAFLTVFRYQTGLELQNEGDTVSLYDSSNTKIDEQSFPSILGYNTTMGRSNDSKGSWNICFTPSTAGLPNNCPIPTPSPTPLPTSTPSNTPTVTPTVTPTQTPSPPPVTAGTHSNSSPFDSANQYVLSNTKQRLVHPEVNYLQTGEYSLIWYGIIVIGAGIACVIVAFGILKTLKK